MPRALGMYYEARGDKQLERPPLILIHGAGGNRLHWPMGLRRLEAERVYNLDLPGHGESRDLPGERSICGYLDRVTEWMSAVGISQGVLVGHSMGGAIAQMGALEAGDRVAGLVLVGTGGRLRVHPDILEMARDPSRFKEAVAIVSGWHFGPDAPKGMITAIRGWMLTGRPQVMYEDYLACDAFDVMGRVQEIKAPTLVIGGTQDRLTPEKYSRFLADHIPGARLELIDGAGHMVMLEEALGVVAAIKRFMAETYAALG